MANSSQVVIDWAVPSGSPDWLLGTGATAPERAVVWSATGAAVIALAAVAMAQDVPWAWWQWLVVLALTIDVAGGVAANALGTAKRFYHSPPPPGLRPLPRLLRHHVGFAAVHVHPFVVAALLADATLVWGTAWYLVSLGGTIMVVTAPLYLRRALAAGLVTTALVAAPLVDPPAGLAWLGPVLVLKLVAAHAVREEPYRPASAPVPVEARQHRSGRAAPSR
jgi:hypothetical protein